MITIRRTIIIISIMLIQIITKPVILIDLQ